MQDCPWSSPAKGIVLLSIERHAVGALLSSGICLVGADDYLVQRAVVLRTAMILALSNSTLDATICTTLMIHTFPLLNEILSSRSLHNRLRETVTIISPKTENIMGKN